MVIQKKFTVHDNRKRYPLIKIGDGWKNQKSRLYHMANKDRMIPLEQLIMHPLDDILELDWASFV